MNGEPMPVWMRVVGTIPRLIGLALFGVASGVGVAAIMGCREDWAIAGATAVMAAWTFHWLMRLAIFHRVATEAGGTRLSKSVQAAGYAVAAVAFLVAAFRHGTGFVQWWPFFVAMLFVWAMAVSARDGMRLVTRELSVTGSQNARDLQ